MPRIITHKGKRYEVTDQEPILNHPMIATDGEILEVKSETGRTAAITFGYKMLLEIPLYPTQSGIALEIDRREAILERNFSDEMFS